MFGEVIETLTQVNVKMAPEKVSNQEICSPCSNQYESCACSKEPEPCPCGPDSCRGQHRLEECTVDALMVGGSKQQKSDWLFTNKAKEPRALKGGEWHCLEAKE